MKTIEQILPHMAAAPGRIAALVASLTTAQLRTPPGPDEWSVVDVLAHLRACADVWGGYIARVLAEERPVIREVSPRAWAKQADYRQQTFQSSWEDFSAQRAHLMAVLEALPSEGWSRAAMVRTSGRVLEHTVFYYARRMTHHEQDHMSHFAQLAEAMCGQTGGSIAGK